jgi:hypothetical protein
MNSEGTRGARSAHDEVVEHADEGRYLRDVLVLRLEHLFGRETGEATDTLGTIGLHGGDSPGVRYLPRAMSKPRAGPSKWTGMTQVQAEPGWSTQARLWNGSTGPGVSEAARIWR